MQGVSEFPPGTTQPDMTGNLALDHGTWRKMERTEAEVWFDMVAAAPPFFAEAIGLSIHRIGTSIVLSASKADAAELNRVFASGVDADVSEDELDEVVGIFAGSRLRSARFQLFPLARPASLPDWLDGRGLSWSGRSWARFVRGVEPAPVARTSLRIEEVEPEDGLVFGHVVAAGFGMPVAMATWFSALSGRGKWRLYVAFDQDRPVGGGAMYLGDDWAWLGIASTLPESRGRGAQGAILARRISDAIAAGKSMIVTETGVPVGNEPAPSFRNILRYGFQIAYERKNYRFPEA